jgi:hypothetical protein
MDAYGCALSGEERGRKYERSIRWESLFAGATSRLLMRLHELC